MTMPELRTLANVPSAMIVNGVPVDAVSRPAASLAPGERAYIHPEDVRHEAGDRWTIDASASVYDRGLPEETVIVERDADGNWWCTVPGQFRHAFHVRPREATSNNTIVLAGISYQPPQPPPVTLGRFVKSWWTQSENIPQMVVGSAITFSIWAIGFTVGSGSDLTPLIAPLGLAFGYAPVLRNVAISCWTGKWGYLNTPPLQRAIDEGRVSGAHLPEPKWGIKPLLKRLATSHRSVGSPELGEPPDQPSGNGPDLDK